MDPVLKSFVESFKGKCDYEYVVEANRVDKENLNDPLFNIIKELHYTYSDMSDLLDRMRDSIVLTEELVEDDERIVKEIKRFAVNYDRYDSLTWRFNDLIEQAEENGMDMEGTEIAYYDEESKMYRECDELKCRLVKTLEDMPQLSKYVEHLLF
eukprot:746148-Hanusia_phi.AAC.1